MGNSYEYVWKHNGPLSLSKPDHETSVRFTKPLKEGSVFADLRYGSTYSVVAISKVTEPVYSKDVPKERMHTSDAKPIPEEELTALRNAHKYHEDPDWPYLILP